MDVTELIPDTIILGERSYEAALNLVIAKAQNELLIFDQDFVRGDYASTTRFELLFEFLSKNDLSKLIIILHTATYFVNYCPRLSELLKVYAHKITIYETNYAAKVAKDCFIIADQRHYCRRFHIDQARFKYALNDAETCASLNMRFEELLEETIEPISVTKLGL